MSGTRYLDQNIRDKDLAYDCPMPQDVFDWRRCGTGPLHICTSVRLWIKSDSERYWLQYFAVLLPRRSEIPMFVRVRNACMQEVRTICWSRMVTYDTIQYEMLTSPWSMAWLRFEKTARNITCFAVGSACFEVFLIAGTKQAALSLGIPAQDKWESVFF